MKCMKCHNTLHSEIGEFSMTINGKSIKVINAPVLHCKNCNSVIISDEVKEKAKEFSKVYLYPDNTLDYAECEAGTIMSVMNYCFDDENPKLSNVSSEAKSKMGDLISLIPRCIIKA